MASPLILCHLVLQLQLAVLLLLLSCCCSSYATPLPVDVTASIGDIPTSSSSLSPVLPAVISQRKYPEQREMLVPETLNSMHLRGAWGPPLFVGSDGAQRFFDRLHGFAEPTNHDDDTVKPVATGHQQRAGIDNTGSGGSVPLTVQHDEIKHEASLSSQRSKSSKRADETADDEANDERNNNSVQQKKNWILHQATRSVQHSNDQSPNLETIVPASSEARQMLASLSERIIGQLSAGNPWVNWTQSTGPTVVHSIDNLPIAQFPFVVVQPSPAPAELPAEEQKPPRRGWFSFQRPWQRIYGEGTESKFPPVLERVVQRIQHYFSVFKYEDESRPYVGQAGVEPTVPAQKDETEGTSESAVHDELKSTANSTSAPILLITTKRPIDLTQVEEVDQSTRTEPEHDTTVVVDTESVLQQFNEISESLDNIMRRNDKIIKIDKINEI